MKIFGIGKWFILIILGLFIKNANIGGMEQESMQQGLLSASEKNAVKQEPLSEVKKKLLIEDSADSEDISSLSAKSSPLLTASPSSQASSSPEFFSDTTSLDSMSEFFLGYVPTGEVAGICNQIFIYVTQANPNLFAKGLFSKVNSDLDLYFKSFLSKTKEGDKAISIESSFYKNEVNLLYTWSKVFEVVSKNESGFFSGEFGNLVKIEKLLIRSIIEYSSFKKKLLGSTIERNKLTKLRLLLQRCITSFMKSAAKRLQNKKTCDEKTYKLVQQLYFLETILEQGWTAKIFMRSNLDQNFKTDLFGPICTFFSNNIYCSEIKNFFEEDLSFKKIENYLTEDPSTENMNIIRNAFGVNSVPGEPFRYENNKHIPLLDAQYFTEDMKGLSCLIFRLGFIFLISEKKFINVSSEVEGDKLKVHFLMDLLTHIFRIQNALEDQFYDKSDFRGFLNYVLDIAIENSVFEDFYEISHDKLFDKRILVDKTSRIVNNILLFLVKNNILEIIRHSKNIHDGAIAAFAIGATVSIATITAAASAASAGAALAPLGAGLAVGIGAASSAGIMSVVFGGRAWDSIKNLLTRRPEAIDILYVKREILRLFGHLDQGSMQQDLDKNYEIFLARKSYVSRPNSQEIQKQKTDLSLLDEKEGEFDNPSSGVEEVLKRSIPSKSIPQAKSLKSISSLESTLSEFRRRIENLEETVRSISAKLQQ